MKIAYCIHSLENLRGMERVLLNKANYWIEKYQYEVTIIVRTHKTELPFYAIDSHIKIIYLGIDYPALQSPIQVYKYIQCKIRHKKALSDVLYRIKPDITVSMFGNEKSFLPQIKDGSIKILELHTSQNFLRAITNSFKHNKLKYYISLFQQHQERKYIRRFDKFIVLTQSDKKNWTNFRNIEVIGNFTNIAPLQKATLNNKRVISVGGLSHEKGFDRLINAWLLVKKQYPDWQLTIIGGGNEKEKLIRQVKQLRLESSISILPPTTKIENEYLDSSIYVGSSRFEGFPMVILEALSCGLPCVSFNCPHGPGELISDSQSGYLVPNGNIQILAEKIIALIQDEKARKEMGKQAAIRSKEFSPEIIMEKWNKLFLNLLNI